MYVYKTYITFFSYDLSTKQCMPHHATRSHVSDATAYPAIYAKQLVS